MSRSCLDHTVTMHMCCYVWHHRKQSDVVNLTLVTLATAAAKIGQNLIWQRHAQVFWDWDPNHTPKGMQGTSAHVQVSFIDNPLL